MAVFIFLIIGGVVIYSWLKSSKKSRLQWQSAAEHLGLNYCAGDFGTLGKISGKKGGHRIEISIFSTGGANTSKTYTRYQVDYHEPIRLDFKITRQNTMHRLGKVFGMMDIEVGNSSFDDCVVIRGMQPEAVQHFLTPDRQEVIERLFDAYSDVVVTNERIELNKPGRDGDAAVIAHTAHVLLSVCNDLTDTSLSVAEEAQTRETEEPLPIEEPSTPVIPVIEVPEAVFVEEIVAKPLEYVDENVGVAVLDLEAVATELFGGGAGGSLLVAKTFSSQFKDKTVNGSGLLKRVSKFSYDPIFANAEGVKATLNLCELEGTYSKIKVMAEVKYATEEYDSLKAQVGQSFHFSGTLIAQDSMLNLLYVEGT